MEICVHKDQVCKRLAPHIAQLNYVDPPEKEKTNKMWKTKQNKKNKNNNTSDP